MSWTQLRGGTYRHRKVRRLALALACSDMEARGLLLSLWSWAIDAEPGGDLTGHTAEDLAYTLDWQGDAVKMLNGLLSAGVLDRDQDTGRLTIHNWTDYNVGYREAERSRARRASKSASVGAAAPSEEGATRSRPGRDQVVSGRDQDAGGRDQAIGEDRRGEEKRSDPPYPPTTGGSVALDAVAVDAPEPAAGLAAVVEAWNEGVGSSGVRRAATPSKATAKRDAQLRAAMKRHPEPEAWRWCGRALSLSRHHCGGNDTGWVAALEWLLGRGGGAKLDEWMQRGAELRARGGRPPISPVLITPPPSAAGQRLNAVLDHLHDIGARLEPERERDPPTQGRLAIPPLTRGYVRREEMPS